MQYKLTGIDTHLDFGFGITGEAFYESAEYLKENKDAIEVSQLVEMPINFCYRHSIELFLKSLIIIFHNKLKINYDDLPPTSDRPKIQVSGEWRNLFNCHWLGELYDYWKDSLLLPNIEKLQLLAPIGQWVEEVGISSDIAIITKYDKQSSYFRYPVTKNKDLDLRKFTMQDINVNMLPTILSNKKTQIINEGANNDSRKIIMAIKDERGQISTAYVKDENVLSEVSDALKRVSLYFFCFHIMTRCTLCEGR